MQIGHLFRSFCRWLIKLLAGLMVFLEDNQPNWFWYSLASAIRTFTSFVCRRIPRLENHRKDSSMRSESHVQANSQDATNLVD